MQKKNYETPKLEIILFAAEESLASGGNDNFASAGQFPDPYILDENM